jgi:DnaJ-class molecular chaperone
MATWYDMLELDREASIELVEKSFERKSQLFQPNDGDLPSKSDSVEKEIKKKERREKKAENLLDIYEAFRILKDPELRKEYDAELAKKETLYTELNITPTASVDYIRKSFLMLSLRNHPDKIVDQKDEEENEDLYMSKRKAITDRYTRILEAYRVLSDDNLRRMYDITGEICPGDMNKEEKEELRMELFTFLKWTRSDNVHRLVDLQGNIMLTVSHKNLQVTIPWKNSAGLSYSNKFLVDTCLKKLKTEYIEMMLKSITTGD